MDHLLALARLVIALRKVQPTLTFPKLTGSGSRKRPGEFADDRRETPIVEQYPQVKLRYMLGDAATMRVLGAENEEDLHAMGLRLRPRPGKPGGGKAATGMVNHDSTASYAMSSKLRDNFGDRGRPHAHPNEVVATKLHEDLHQMFGRVQRGLSSNHRQQLARNLINSLPEEERKAVQDFSSWKGYSPDDHEEVLANLISYHNQPGERRAYRQTRFKHMGPGETGWLAAAPEIDQPRERARPAGSPWSPEHTPGYDPRPSREHSANMAALAHDQRMKRALHRLRRTARDVDLSWTWHRQD